MGHFQQELIAGILATVIGGLILALLTGSGGASKFLRFVLIVGILGVVGALVLSQMRGSGWRRRGDVPVITRLAAVLAHERAPKRYDGSRPFSGMFGICSSFEGGSRPILYRRPVRLSHQGQTPGESS
jgi:hypothetical protein